MPGQRGAVSQGTIDASTRAWEQVDELIENGETDETLWDILRYGSPANFRNAYTRKRTLSINRRKAVGEAHAEMVARKTMPVGLLAPETPTNGTTGPNPWGDVGAAAALLYDALQAAIDTLPHSMVEGTQLPGWLDTVGDITTRTSRGA